MYRPSTPCCCCGHPSNMAAFVSQRLLVQQSRSFFNGTIIQMRVKDEQVGKQKVRAVILLRVGWKGFQNGAEPLLVGYFKIYNCSRYKNYKCDGEIRFSASARGLRSAPPIFPNLLWNTIYPTQVTCFELSRMFRTATVWYVPSLTYFVTSFLT